MLASGRQLQTTTPGGKLVADFVETVRLQKEKLGLTHAQIASRTGLSRQYIYKLLEGDRNVSLETAEKLAKALEFKIRVSKT